MKLRTLRRTQSRRWDSVHDSLLAMDDGYIWPMRTVKPCEVYHAYCDTCNTVLFAAVFKRYPYSVDEYDAFARSKQAEWGPL